MILLWWIGLRIIQISDFCIEVIVSNAEKMNKHSKKNLSTWNMEKNYLKKVISKSFSVFTAIIFLL